MSMVAECHIDAYFFCLPRPDHISVLSPVRFRCVSPTVVSCILGNFVFFAPPLEEVQLSPFLSDGGQCILYLSQLGKNVMLY